MHAQDNANPDGANDNKCTIYDGHDRQDTSANGCNQVGGSARTGASSILASQLYNNHSVGIVRITRAQTYLEWFRRPNPAGSVLC